MKQLSLSLFLLFFTATSFAQDAKTLMQEVASKVRSYDNIQIDFKYNVYNAQDNLRQETRGDVTLESDKYVLNMMGTTRIFDGKNIYTIIPEDEEVTISAYKSTDESAITPSSMLTFYEKGYRYEMDIQQNVKGRKIQFIKLIPTTAKTSMKQVLLGIDAQTKHIYKLIQTDDQGTQHTLTVHGFKVNQPLSKTLFQFDEARYKQEGYYLNKL